MLPSRTLPPTNLLEAFSAAHIRRPLGQLLSEDLDELVLRRPAADRSSPGRFFRDNQAPSAGGDMLKGFLDDARLEQQHKIYIRKMAFALIAD